MSDVSFSSPGGPETSPADKDWRGEFPVTQRLAYLNHAAVAPLATRTRRAMETLLAEVNESGALHGSDWLAGYAAARRSLARLLGAAETEIALLKNTSEGLATIAQGMNWRPGDRVVTAGCEFPSNLYPWLALRERGVRVDLLSDRQGAIDLDELRRRCRGARLLSLSFVQYLSGARLDVAAVGAICREAGTFFLLDGIQGLGAFPLDVKAAGVHALAADGHKWLTGPEGCAVFYLDRERMAEIAPHEVGWLSVAPWADFSAARRAAAESGTLPWAAGAARYECGTLNTVGVYGLRTAVELLLEAGVEEIARRIVALTDGLVAGLLARGAEIHGPRGDASASPSAFPSGIVSFRLPDVDSATLVRRLEAKAICCAQRGGWVRCSPHFYNSPADIERLLQALAA